MRDEARRISRQLRKAAGAAALAVPIGQLDRKIELLLAEVRGAQVINGLSTDDRAQHCRALRLKSIGGRKQRTPLRDEVVNKDDFLAFEGCIRT